MEKKRRGRIIKFLFLAFFFVLGAILIASAGPDILSEIKGLDPLFLGLAISCYLGLHLAWGIKFFLLVKRRVKNAYFPYVLLANMAGNFINVTTPSGRMAGEPVRAKTIASRYGSRFSTVFAAAMVDKASLTIALLLFLIPLAIFATISFNMPPLLQYLTIGFVLFWVVIGAVSYILFRNMSEARSMKMGAIIHKISRLILGSRSKDRSYFIEKARQGIKEFKDSFKFLAKDPLYMGVDLLLALLTYGFRFAAAYMFFQAAGHSVDLLTVSAVVMIAFAIGLLSQMPGMVGIAESTMWGLYLAAGIRPTLAITISILTQMNSYLFEIGLGYFAMISVNLLLARYKAKKERSSNKVL
ncbi:MAG: flippase-like domain-containing protein [Candidatus Thermoplasmatota archaeon]|nr:flippase-like domain-containing protein [Candidatus Thermoplasmatota archaeon]